MGGLLGATLEQIFNLFARENTNLIREYKMIKEIFS